MATSLIKEGRIKTTLAKGKAVKPIVEKLITLAKRGGLHAIRQAASILTTNEATKKLFKIVDTQFSNRSCGYTSMVKCGFRKGDAAPMVILWLTSPKDIKAGRGSRTVKGSDRTRRVMASKAAQLSSNSGEPDSPSETSPSLTKEIIDATTSTEVVSAEAISPEAAAPSDAQATDSLDSRSAASPVSETSSEPEGNSEGQPSSEVEAKEEEPKS
jgi:large subunit ribosomal protein L17